VAAPPEGKALKKGRFDEQLDDGKTPGGHKHMGPGGGTSSCAKWEARGEKASSQWEEMPEALKKRGH